MPYPTYDVDFFSDEVIADPYPHYAALRALGPVVRLPALDVLAVSRYADVKAVLADHVGYSSAEGVSFNTPMNEMSKGSSLASDEPLHSQLRNISSAPLQRRALVELKAQIASAAEDLIAQLLRKGRFDGINELAHHLPISIVSNLVGLPEEGRENMMSWSAAIFDASGALDARFTAAVPKVQEMLAYTVEKAGPAQVRPGSWAGRIYEAGDQGLITAKQATGLLLDYLGPSLDTTIFATGHMLYLLGTHPDQWQKLKADASLVANAVEEVLRLEAPIRAFTRLATVDREIDGVHTPAGSRVAILFASANRDERQWASPEAFDITRPNAGSHLAFGYGRHVCAGQHLAKLELCCLLEAMVRQVGSMSVEAPVLAHNSLLRGYHMLPVTFMADPAC